MRALPCKSVVGTNDNLMSERVEKTEFKLQLKRVTNVTFSSVTINYIHVSSSSTIIFFVKNVGTDMLSIEKIQN